MPTVNELLDRAKAEFRFYYLEKFSLCQIYSRNMNGTKFLEVTNCSLAPYFPIV